MTPTSYRCVCGATIQYKQDLQMDDGTTRRHFKCRDCGTPVPGQIGEKVAHQNPS